MRFHLGLAVGLALLPTLGCGSSVETASQGSSAPTASGTGGTSTTGAGGATSSGAGGTGSSAGGNGGAGGNAGGGGGAGNGCTVGETQPCYDGPAGTAGVGVCQSGLRTCDDAGLWSGCVGEVTPTAETCNGADDDCNGTADDGLGQVTCGVGACQVTVETCTEGTPVDCVPLAPAAHETCNSIDDTCDGTVDEGCDCLDGDTQPCFTGPQGAVGVGACIAGTQTCAGGAWGLCTDDVVPVPESCNGVDDDCNGAVDDGLGTVSCGVGACSAIVPACENGKPVACVAGSPSLETCNGIDDDCNGAVDDGFEPLACGVGACAATAPACANGQPGVCVPGTPSVEVCNGVDDDCNGKVDEAFGNCGPGQTCASGACVDDCAGEGAAPCAAGTVCNVGDAKTGQCVPVGEACVVTGPFEPCGGKTCGPGSSCNSKLGECMPALPCVVVDCEGPACHGSVCPCARPAPSCAVAPLASLNTQAFTFGLVDLDVDLQCNAWAVTVISGPDYLRKMSPAGQMTTVTGVTNLNMGEVAALQGIGSIGQSNVIDVALTYNCCAGCGCQANPPQGVAHYDALTNTLPMVIPATQTTEGPGPFGDVYLDTGPQGLSFGLGRQVYIGNIGGNGDFYVVDLDTSTKSLVATLPARVYAAAPYDATRLLVATATKEIVYLYIADGSTKPFATAPADVTSLVRDPFSGDVYVGQKGGVIRRLSGKGVDLGQFAKAQGSGRLSIARDNYLYQLDVAPVAHATVERFALPASY